jgi:hypothetical protein
MVLVIAVIAGGGYAALQLINPGEAQLVKARGQVLWNGKPVTIGAVMTEHVDDPFQAALGALDKEGRFELDTNGIPGAALGRHKLIVASYEEGGVAPPPLVPSKYVSYNTTPLVIEITSDPEKNVYAINLEGELDRRRGPPPAESSEEPQETEAAGADAAESAADEDAAETAPESKDSATP